MWGSLLTGQRATAMNSLPEPAHTRRGLGAKSTWPKWATVLTYIAPLVTSQPWTDDVRVPSTSEFSKPRLSSMPLK